MQDNLHYDTGTSFSEIDKNAYNEKPFHFHLLDVVIYQIRKIYVFLGQMKVGK